MESSTIEQIRKRILEDGFFCEINPACGERVDKINKKGFPFNTEEGLDFFKISTVDDKVSRVIYKGSYIWRIF